MRRACLVMLLLFVTHIAAANSYYIDPVNGSNGGDGSAANPWKSLQAVFDAGLIETRDWPSYPYVPGMQLEPINVGAPVKAGDTLWLRSGYHGDLVVASAYNSAPITIAAQPGQAPRIRSVLVRSAQNWILRNLTVSASFAPVNESVTLLSIENHNWTGPAWDVEIAGCRLSSVEDASSWGVSQWLDLASDGMYVGGDRVNVHDCSVRNVRFGIAVDGADAVIRRNVVDGFSADGLRGLGDRGLFEYNTVRNDYLDDDVDPNHDDGFQSWSVGTNGQVGTGAVDGVILRGNLFVNADDPSNPLRGTMQGIGCFDGLFTNWIVENNVVITDHWHGISFYGMRDSRIVNNTVIDLAAGTPGPPWIGVFAHKDGRPSQRIIVRNNLATDYSLTGEVITDDHNLTISDAASLFVAPPFDLHLRAGAAAIDAGSSVLAPTLDIEGRARPQGAGFDLGAYEWAGDLIFRDGFQAG